jgi:hypothetical protein
VHGVYNDSRNSKRFKLSEWSEADVNNTSTSLQSNMKGNVLLTRYLYGTMHHTQFKNRPARADALLRSMAEDLKSLYHDGVQVSDGEVYYGACIGEKADMPMHAKSGRLSRTFAHLPSRGYGEKGICLNCLAGEPGHPFEDTSWSALWIQTIGMVRAVTDGYPMQCVPHDETFPELFFRGDPFHIGKLGVGQEFVGSNIVMLGELGYFPGHGNSVQAILLRATASFLKCCRDNQKHPNIKSISKELLHFAVKEDFPWISCKGSDTMLLCRWQLQYVALQVPKEEWHGPCLDAIQLGADAFLKFFRCLYSNGLLLNRAITMEIIEHGFVFLRAFSFLAKTCLAKGLHRFAMKPKFHAWHEMLVMLQSQLDQGLDFVISPVMDVCESDESFIGIISRLSRKVHISSVNLRVMQRHLVKIKCLWARLGP